MKDKEKQIFKFSVIDNKTSEYPDLYNIALKEDWAKGLMYCDMEGFSINEDGQLILSDECGKFVYCPSDRFTVVFKDSVVLTREELQEIIVKAKVKENEKISELKKEVKELNKLLIQEKEGSFWDGVNEGILKGSKETAEKIIDLIKAFCPDKKFVEVITHIISERLGVEIKE